MGNDLEIRRSLGKTWYAFFGRFGSRLTEVQRVAIPEVLTGSNLVLCAPTASGKTEAILAPVVQRLLDSGLGEGVQLLYITPTRALASDLLERIQGPLERVGWRAGIWTSDRKANLKTPPQIIVTTPEGFDSLLSRHTEDLVGLKVVVLDELHMIDGGYRGDQLRILLERLRLVLDRPVWTCILSATLADPNAVAARYMDEFRIVTIRGDRPIAWRVLSSVGRPVPDEAFDLLRKARARKILVFCNTRNDVELVASDIDRGFLKDRVLVHHGLIGREERLSVEEAFKDWPVAACVATSTLEVGIDIGDVDVVVLYGCPPSVASLLQRIGRGNRRTGEIFAVGISLSAAETEQFTFLFNLGASGTLQTREYAPKLGDAIQQIFSYLVQRRSIGTRKSHLVRMLRPFELVEEDVDGILASLVAEEWVEIDSYGRILPARRLEKEIEYGKMHSNIPDTGSWTVVDEAGLEIGFATEIAPVFLIGGKAREVVRIDYRWQKVYVKTVRARKADLVLSGGVASDQGKYYHLLPERLHEKSGSPFEVRKRRRALDSADPSLVRHED